MLFPLDATHERIEGGNVTRIGIGIVGGGYMGKAHAVAMNAVASVFDTPLRPVLEMICTTTEAGAADKARQFGAARSTSCPLRLALQAGA